MNKLKKSALKNRFRFVIYFTLFGLSLAWFYVERVEPQKYFEDIVGLDRSLILVLLSLPTATYFWWIRNHDKLESNRISQESLNNSSFQHAISMLEGDNEEFKEIAMKRLLYMRNNLNLFKDEIDAIIKNNLEQIDLNSANLQGAKYNKYTRFPDGFDPKDPKHGMIFVSDDRD